MAICGTRKLLPNRKKLEDPTLLRKTGKDIARVLTVLRQREQAGAVVSAADSEAK